jgi:hypothetical protein
MTRTKHVNLGDTAFRFAHPFQSFLSQCYTISADERPVIKTPRVLSLHRAECFAHNIQSLGEIILTDASARDSGFL